jgi:adenylate cyclase
MLRCEDARLAVRLGLRIVDELDGVDGFPPVRVGMHTGPAVQRAGDWYGTTVNVAARLCSAASGGEVLVSEATHEAATPLDDVEFEDQRLHWLKNLTDPVAARIASSREQVHRLCPFARRRRDRRPKKLLSRMATTGTTL